MWKASIGAAACRKLFRSISHIMRPIASRWEYLRTFTSQISSLGDWTGWSWNEAPGKLLRAELVSAVGLTMSRAMERNGVGEKTEQSIKEEDLSNLSAYPSFKAAGRRKSALFAGFVWPCGSPRGPAG